MPFTDPNTELGLQRRAKFQVGRSNIDADKAIEEGVSIPWSDDPQATYLYYNCAVGTMLDSGIVVHNRLPGIHNGIDTLSSVNLDDPNLDSLVGPGVNLKCKDQYEDIMQRMGHARYWFRLWGQALRAGYRVPIPGIKTIGGVPAIPYDRNPQWAYNRILPGANFGGVILWHAQWSLWYTTLIPPKTNKIPEVDAAAHISGDATVPTNIQTPYSQADDSAQPAAPQRVPNQGQRV